MLEFVTAKEKAVEWDVSQRRVAIFCKEGRVPGATMIGKMWLIPKDAKKPNDPRRVQIKGQQV